MDQIFEMCGPRDADVVMELSGALPALQNAPKIVRPGGRIVIGSVYSGFADQSGACIDYAQGTDCSWCERTISASQTNGTSASVDTLAKLQADLRKLITVNDYKDGIRAFEDMVSGSAIKPVIRFR